MIKQNTITEEEIKNFTNSVPLETYINCLLKEQKKEADEEIYSMLSTLLNNLEDDLELDLNNGESGYKSYEDSYKAVKNFTLRQLKEEIKRLEIANDEEKVECEGEKE